MEVDTHAFSSIAVNECGWSTSRPGRFKPVKQQRYPLNIKLSGPLFFKRKILVSTRIRTSYRRIVPMPRYPGSFYSRRENFSKTGHEHPTPPPPPLPPHQPLRLSAETAKSKIPDLQLRLKANTSNKTTDYVGNKHQSRDASSK